MIFAFNFIDRYLDFVHHGAQYTNMKILHIQLAVLILDKQSLWLFVIILCFHFPIQRAIPHRIQQDIITELRTPDRLRETLDVVDIVLGFLSSGGGTPKVTLKKYIDTHQMKKKTFSAKVC